MSRFSNIWCFFERFLPHNNSSVLVEWFFACFCHLKFLSQTDHFGRAIAFAWAMPFSRWPIFKFALFFEYLVFFWAVFCTKHLYCSCRMVSRMFLAFLIFDLSWPFCKGYSLCFLKLSHLSNTCVFSSSFSPRTHVMFLWMVFRMFLAFLIFDPNWPFCKGYSLHGL